MASPSWSLTCLALAVTMLFIAGCSTMPSSPAPTPFESYRPVQSVRPSNEYLVAPHTAVASWYGHGFAGRRTSSGETYNPEALTAASPTLPLGSHVRVTNPDTGRSVVVRINDRGPFVHGRSMDLSHGAAERIGLVGKGVGRVTVTPTAASTPSYTLAESSYAPVYSNESSAVRTETRYSSHHSSYVHRVAYVRPSRRRRRYASSSRMVANPIGAWLDSMLPRK